MSDKDDGENGGRGEQDTDTPYIGCFRELPVPNPTGTRSILDTKSE